jgi:hypothetical protein
MYSIREEKKKEGSEKIRDQREGADKAKVTQNYSFGSHKV